MPYAFFSVETTAVVCSVLIDVGCRCSLFAPSPSGEAGRRQQHHCVLRLARLVVARALLRHPRGPGPPSRPAHALAGENTQVCVCSSCCPVFRNVWMCCRVRLFLVGMCMCDLRALIFDHPFRQRQRQRPQRAHGPRDGPRSQGRSACHLRFPETKVRTPFPFPAVSTSTPPCYARFYPAWLRFVCFDCIH